MAHSAKYAVGGVFFSESVRARVVVVCVLFRVCRTFSVHCNVFFFFSSSSFSLFAFLFLKSPPKSTISAVRLSQLFSAHVARGERSSQSSPIILSNGRRPFFHLSASRFFLSHSFFSRLTILSFLPIRRVIKRRKAIANAHKKFLSEQ